jgi:hypothetical protein
LEVCEAVLFRCPLTDLFLFRFHSMRFYALWTARSRFISTERRN